MATNGVISFLIGRSECKNKVDKLDYFFYYPIRRKMTTFSANGRVGFGDADIQYNGVADITSE